MIDEVGCVGLEGVFTAGYYNHDITHSVLWTGFVRSSNLSLFFPPTESYFAKTSFVAFVLFIYSVLVMLTLNNLPHFNYLLHYHNLTSPNPISCAYLLRPTKYRNNVEDRKNCIDG